MGGELLIEKEGRPDSFPFMIPQELLCKTGEVLEEANWLVSTSRVPCECSPLGKKKESGLVVELPQ